MEIDLDQLPIPDWGLLCPVCRYPLRGLPEHRCPESGLEFDMRNVVKPWHRLRAPRFAGDELPFPDFGLRCEVCRSPLAGAPTRVCPQCAAPFSPEDFRPQSNTFLVDPAMVGQLTLAGVEALLAADYVPYQRAAGKGLSEIYGLSSPAGSQLLVPAEFYFEVRWLIQRTAAAIQQRREHPDAEWTCPSCGESVPMHFDLCWKCQTPRDAPAQ